MHSSSPRRSSCLRNGFVEPQLVISSEISPQEDKQSPLHGPIMSMSVSSKPYYQPTGVMVEADDDDENDVGCFSPEAVKSTAGLCFQYRQILKAHVSLQSMLHAGTIKDDDSDDDTSLASSCCGMDDADLLDGDGISLCDLDSLAGSFLSEVDSVKIRRNQIAHQSPAAKQDLSESCMEDLLDEDNDEEDVDSTVDTVYSFDLGYIMRSQQQ